MNAPARHRRVILALAVLAVAAGTAAAGNWPRFRGPNGTGVAADKNVPVKFSASDGILWKTPIPGVGHSSPIVWGSRVFLQTAADDGSDRRLLCLDAADGKVLWSRAAPGRRAHTHRRSSLASSTPATDGERVYAIFWNGRKIHLTAYDFKGTEVWTRDLGGFKSQHGAGMSPVVYDGKVFVNMDQDGAAELVALDARSGKPAWRAARKAFRTCYSTPFLRKRPDGKDELVVASTAGITGYNPTSGAENWTYTWSFTGMPLRTVGSPILASGLIVIGSGDGRGDRDLIAVRPGDKGDVTSTNLVWEERKSFPYVPTLLSKGDHLYSVNDSGFAACHVTKTGEEVWRVRLGSPVSSSPILVDGKVYAVGEDGTVFVFQAATTFKLLGKSELGETVFSSPAVADGRLFIRGREHLFCIGKSSNKKE